MKMRDRFTRTIAAVTLFSFTGMAACAPAGGSPSAAATDRASLASVEVNRGGVRHEVEIVAHEGDRQFSAYDLLLDGEAYRLDATLFAEDTVFELTRGDDLLATIGVRHADQSLVIESHDGFSAADVDGVFDLTAEEIARFDPATFLILHPDVLAVMKTVREEAIGGGAAPSAVDEGLATVRRPLLSCLIVGGIIVVGLAVRGCTDDDQDQDQQSN